MQVLARATSAELARWAAPVANAQRFDWLRHPEPGLVMLRGRIGNSGDRFNLGEATVTRCVVRVCLPEGESAAGVGYVLGRDTQRASWVACIDALLQLPLCRADVMRRVIEPLAAAAAARRAAAQARTATSRVEFHTLQAEVAR
ncbi:alpha-D-ribose 1-methylphosphonate 5-triphosphate synthase subunit PhnG [Caldimonas brevitalea]|uniref:Alpha-D-ribose 1-methylphosphonate 5-triphosphate synthase subunit PhnG n=1 Tax=Caldimonas brevitalea TaxID=413882 RepID=A0A0G3BQX5_9BURK|nr:alpha-D-ribose 1-methylphosphonate 5-triphosphate synthase subunit PhnG [Caldimonas brevitalea]